MPRPKRIETTQELRDYIRKKTNWRKMIQTLEKMAHGGYEFLNYNGQKSIAEPNLEALKLLIYYVYGKLPDSQPIKDDSGVKSMELFNQLVSNFNKPITINTEEIQCN